MQSKNGLPARNEWFDSFARKAALFCGKPLVFLSAVGIVIVWAASGPLFSFSDTWQLVINTGTTIVTFLMVFLIQNTQNRDTMAVQVKLAELIVALQGAENKLAAAEDMSEQELEELHEKYRQRVNDTSDALKTRRNARSKSRNGSRRHAH
jgi:low affinity Fe/Cu permease